MIEKKSTSKISYQTSFSSTMSYVLGLFAREGAGKTRLCASGPTITGIIPTDRKTRKVVERVMKELGKEPGTDILMPKEDFVRDMRPMELAGMDKDESKKRYREYVEGLKQVAWDLYENGKVKLIAIDNAGDLHQSMTYANYGRAGHKTVKIGDVPMQLTSEADQEFVDFVNSISSKPLILTHRTKDEYHKNVKTGRMTWQGYKYLGNLADATIEMERNLRYQEGNEQEDRSWCWGVNIQTCNLRPELQGPNGKHSETGMRDEMITFANLATLIFPDANVEMFI